EPSQLFAALDDPPPVCNDPREAAQKCVELPRLPAVKGDILGIFAQPDHTEAEISLEALLIKSELNQRAADPPGQHRADNGIDQCGKDHVARDDDRCTTAKRNPQSAGQNPQD